MVVPDQVRSGINDSFMTRARPASTLEVLTPTHGERVDDITTLSPGFAGAM